MSTKARDAREFEKALDDARKVRETMQTEGWKIISRIFDDGMNALDSLRGVTSMKEVLGKQYANATLKRFMASLTDIVDKVGEAEKRLLPDEESIYKIMKGKESID